MTLYAGAHVRVTDKAKFDGVAMVPADVTSVSITIFDAVGAIVVNPSAMTWDSAKLRWQYLWDTTGIDAGTYTARVTITTLDGATSPAWLRIHLKCSPA